MSLFKKIILFFFVFELGSQSIDLTKSEFFVREGFEKEWIHLKPENCIDCRIVSFHEEAFKSIRIKKVFPEKFEVANRIIDLNERRADTFTIGTTFHLQELPNQNVVYGILLERIGINWEIYLNGQLLRSEMHLDEVGKVKIHKATRLPLISIPSELLKQGDNHLFFRLTGDIRDTYLAIFLNSSEIDTIENLTFRQWDLFRFFIHTSYFILAILYLVLFLIYPAQKFNLYFSFSLLLYGIFRFSDSYIAFRFIDDSNTQQNIYSISFILLSGTMIFFSNYLIDDKIHWLTKFNFLLTLLLSFIKLFLPHALTFFFLYNIVSNSGLLVFFYLILYRIGYIGLKDFLEKYKKELKIKNRFALLYSIKHSWNTRIEFMLAIFMFFSYLTAIVDYAFFTKYDSIYFTADFAFLFFYGLMAFFTYQRRRQTEEKYKSELEKLKWEKETEKIKQELEIIEEREKIFADIHDNLGGKLLDLSFQLNRIQEDAIIPSSTKEKIKNTINSVLKGLRNRLLIFEDMKKIEENFAVGLQIFLIRRYNLAERKIVFQSEKYSNKSRIQKESYSNLLNIISELVNNDLKYGYGISHWTLASQDNRIVFQMRSNTNWNQEKVHVGNGHITIIKRVEALNIKFSDRIEDGKYFAEIRIPESEIVK